MADSNEISDVVVRQYNPRRGVVISVNCYDKRRGYESRIKGCHVPMRVFDDEGKSVKYNGKWMTVKQANELVYGLK